MPLSLWALWMRLALGNDSQSLFQLVFFFLAFTEETYKLYTKAAPTRHFLFPQTSFWNGWTCVNCSTPLFLFYVTVLLLINRSGRSTHHDSKAHRKLDNIKWVWMHSKNIDRRVDIISIFWNHYIRCTANHAFQTTSLQAGCFILTETFPWRLFILIKLLFWNYWTIFLWKSKITLHIKVLWLSWQYFFLDCRKLQTDRVWVKDKDSGLHGTCRMTPSLRVEVKSAWWWVVLWLPRQINMNLWDDNNSVTLTAASYFPFVIMSGPERSLTNYDANVCHIRQYCTFDRLFPLQGHAGTWNLKERTWRRGNGR